MNFRRRITIVLFILCGICGCIYGTILLFFPEEDTASNPVEAIIGGIFMILIACAAIRFKCISTRYP